MRSTSVATVGTGIPAVTTYRVTTISAATTAAHGAPSTPDGRTATTTDRCAPSTPTGPVRSGRTIAVRGTAIRAGDRTAISTRARGGGTGPTEHRAPSPTGGRPAGTTHHRTPSTLSPGRAIGMTGRACLSRAITGAVAGIHEPTSAELWGAPGEGRENEEQRDDDRRSPRPIPDYCCCDLPHHPYLLGIFPGNPSLN